MSSMTKFSANINGVDVLVDSVFVDGVRVLLTGNKFRKAWVHDEIYVDVQDPGTIIEALMAVNPRPDVFSFWQRLTDANQRFPYPFELQSVAALPVDTYESWFSGTLTSNTRKLIRRSEKRGCYARDCEFDTKFIEGMVEIFNETPVRQGREFWHYGKDVETVRRQFSRNLSREKLVGVFSEEELIGFLFLADAGKYTYVGQILSKIGQREKLPNNLLIAKAVELTAAMQRPYLVYGEWSDGALSEFKRRNGFRPYEVPRYWIPLTAKGAIFLKLNLQKGLGGVLPSPVTEQLKKLRHKWLNRKHSAGIDPAT